MNNQSFKSVRLAIGNLFDELLAFLISPFLLVINHVGVFLFILLFGVAISQTNFPVKDMLAVVKYILLLAFLFFEFLLIRLISLQENILESQHIRYWKIAAVFAGYITITAFFSIDMLTSVAHVGSFIVLIILSLYILPYFSMGMQKKRQIINAIYGIALTFLGINTFALFVGSSLTYTTHEYIRFSGIFDNPNTLGTFYYVSVAVVFYKYMSAESTSGKAFNLFIMFLLFGQTVISFSRASLLGMFVFFLVILFFYKRRLFYIALTVSLAGIIILFSSPLLLELLRLAEDPFTVREKLWQIGIETWLNRPLLGAGYGTAGIITDDPFLFMQKGITFYLLGKHFHNVYVEMLSEVGIIGFTLFLAFLGILFKRAINRVKVSTHEERVLAISYLALLIAVLVHSFFESFLLAVGNVSSIIFWILTGLVLESRGFSAVNSAMGANETP